jgi:nitroreductase
MDRDLSRWDAMSVGMFVQTFLLALTERGLGSCAEVSVVGYPDIVRAELDIPEELSILSGVAVGYADPDFAANKVKIGREPIGNNAVFLDS